jgi:hypothetical protein
VFFGAIADIPGFRDVYGGINGQAPVRRWRHGYGRRSWR